MASVLHPAIQASALPTPRKAILLAAGAPSEPIRTRLVRHILKRRRRHIWASQPRVEPLQRVKETGYLAIRNWDLIECAVYSRLGNIILTHLLTGFGNNNNNTNSATSLFGNKATSSGLFGSRVPLILAPAVCSEAIRTTTTSTGGAFGGNAGGFGSAKHQQ